MKSIGIIGGGPAGLRAAEVAIKNGASVTVYDAMRSVGRKFLVAGKSGLNITNNEDLDTFLTRYSGTDLPNELWREILTQFDNQAMLPQVGEHLCPLFRLIGPDERNGCVERVRVVAASQLQGV